MTTYQQLLTTVITVVTCVILWHTPVQWIYNAGCWLIAASYGFEVTGWLKLSSCRVMRGYGLHTLACAVTLYMYKGAIAAAIAPGIYA